MSLLSARTELSMAEQRLAGEIDSYFKDHLIYKRNRRMGGRVIELLLNNPGTSFFFAFGAGHFVGEHTIIDVVRYAASHRPTIYIHTLLSLVNSPNSLLLLVNSLNTLLSLSSYLYTLLSLVNYLYTLLSLVNYLYLYTLLSLVRRAGFGVEAVRVGDDLENWVSSHGHKNGEKKS